SLPLKRKGLSPRQVELAVLGAGQERLPLRAGVHMRRLAAVLRVTDRDTAAGQVRDLDAVSCRAETALEPVPVIHPWCHRFSFLIGYWIPLHDGPWRPPQSSRPR